MFSSEFFSDKRQLDEKMMAMYLSHKITDTKGETATTAMDGCTS